LHLRCQFFINKYICHYTDDGHFNFRILNHYKVTYTYLVDYYPFAITFLCPANFFASLFRICLNKGLF
jgi:hypothetical protein